MAFEVCVPTSAPTVWGSKGLGGDFASGELASWFVSPWWASVPPSISKRSTYIYTSKLLGKLAGPASPAWDDLHRRLNQKEVYYLWVDREREQVLPFHPFLNGGGDTLVNNTGPVYSQITLLTKNEGVPYSSAGAIVEPMVPLVSVVPPDDLPVSSQLYLGHLAKVVTYLTQELELERTLDSRHRGGSCWFLLSRMCTYWVSEMQMQG